VRGAEPVASRVDRGHPGAHPQLDPLVGVPRLVVREGLVTLVLAEQVALGQRRPLVGQLRFLADQHHPAVEALRPQRLGGLRAGQRRAHDHEHPVAHSDSLHHLPGFTPDVG
jgi:hypothetical protein